MELNQASFKTFYEQDDVAEYEEAFRQTAFQEGQFWNNRFFPDGRWVVAYKTDNDVSLDPDDEKAILALIPYLLSQDQSFFLACYIDKDGQINRHHYRRRPFLGGRKYASEWNGI